MAPYRQETASFMVVREGDAAGISWTPATEGVPDLVPRLLP